MIIRPVAKVIGLLGIAVSVAGLSIPQTPRTRQRTSRAPNAAIVDYSKFSHATKKHQAACSSCHKVPTEGWRKTSSFPDVTDFPDHAACVGCHRVQFFKGAKPPICAGCHTQTAPRAASRLLFQDAARERQFTIEFPHDKHQDVIANLNRGPESSVAFAHTSYRSEPVVDEKANYNNCSICHRQRSQVPVLGWQDAFHPDAATFKSVPNTHEMCFSCHWQAAQPVNENCGGCHKLANVFKSTDVPVRISLKFKHEGGGEKKNHVAECTSCHINITKASSVRGLKPDVPITACTECHNHDGLRQDLNKELAALDKDRSYTCSYCHTSNIGKLDPPASHYLIAQRTPVRRSDIK
ncbi:MAG: cytochrome c3 family protein [Pyrinomonadaceae bacterium]